MGQEISESVEIESGAPTERKTKRLDVARQYVRNRMKLGLYVPRGPRTLNHPERQAQRFREHIENEVVQRHGELSYYHNCKIQSATLALRHATFCGHWLRTEADKLDTAARLALSREIVNALKTRDSILQELGLDKPVSPVVQGGLAPMIWTDEPTKEE